MMQSLFDGIESLFKNVFPSDNPGHNPGNPGHNPGWATGGTGGFGLDWTIMDVKAAYERHIAQELHKKALEQQQHERRRALPYW